MVDERENRTGGRQATDRRSNSNVSGADNDRLGMSTWRSRRRWGDIVVGTTLLALLGYLSWPLWSWRQYQPERRVIELVQAKLAQRVADKRVPAGRVITAATEYSFALAATPLVSVSVTLFATQDFVGQADAPVTPRDASPSVSTIRLTRRVEWGVLLLLLVLMAAAWGIYRFFFSRAWAPPPDDHLPPSRRPELGDSSASGSLSGQDHMRGELRLLEHDMAEMLARSRYSLGGALAMAFVSVAVFFLAQGWIAPHIVDEPGPSVRADAPREAGASEATGSAPVRREALSNAWLTLLEMSRPFVVLLLLETILWFLLREYRASIDDYKALYRVYLKRSAYLTAFKIVETSPGGTTAIGAALINDDPSLATPATTSTDDAATNPLPELLKVLFGQLSPKA